MADQFGRQASAVLSDDTQRVSGDDAVSMNIEAGSAVAEAVRTTLGPRGMDKMLVSDDGDVVVTNDGVTVLEAMDVDHPVADMIVDIADTQETEVGDGTTTAVVVAGELFREAEDLLDRDIHPSTVVGGYRRAASEIDGVLDDLAIEVSPDDRELLERVAETAMTGKGAEGASDTLVSLVVDAVTRSSIDGAPEPDAIKIQPFDGKTIHESRLVEGAMVNMDPPHPDMPRTATDADVLIYDGDLEVRETAPGADIEVSSADEYQAFVDREREELDSLAEGIVDAGVDALFVTGGIDESVQGILADADVLAVRRLRDDDLEILPEVTGATVVGNLADLSDDDLGYAGNIEKEVIANAYGPKTAQPEKSLVLTDLPDTTAASIVLRGGTQHVVDEVERAVEDAIRAVALTLREGVVVPGGGATEVVLARGLRDAADGVEGREQLAIEAVADALEVVPRTLATNAGANPIDALVDVRAEQENGLVTAGIDGNEGAVRDVQAAGVVEPREVKSQALSAGIEAVTSVLRIDDVLSVGDLAVEDDDEDAAGGGPAAGGGMGGGMGGMM